MYRKIFDVTKNFKNCKFFLETKQDLYLKCPCLVHPKTKKLFKIPRHINLAYIYGTLNIDKN